MYKVKQFIYYAMILFLGFTLVSCRGLSSGGEADGGGPMRVIFDTDIGGDYDDVGALGMLHALADRGEVKILATVASNKSPLVVPSIEVINTYFGRGDLPIGAPKTGGVSHDSGELRWPHYLAEHYPHTYQSTSEAPDAVAVYRKILARQPDSSVTIITVGFLTNMKNLLMSEPDGISPMGGAELVARKVQYWVAMAGAFPEGKEYNVHVDAASSSYAIEHWPTPIVFSGFEIGDEVLTGLRLIKDGPEDSPIRMTYALSIPQRAYDRNGRRSWDQTAVLVAIRGLDPYYSWRTGWFVTRPDGSNGWRDDPDGKHRYLVRKMDPKEVTYEIETLMMHQRQ